MKTPKSSGTIKGRKVLVSFWSEVFTYKNVSIIIAKSQNFNYKSPKRTDNSIKVFDFEYHISFLQLIAMDERINENDLEFWNRAVDFTRFTQKTIENNLNMNVAFLVRNWKMNANFDFGFGGGSDYIDDIFATNQNDINQNARKLSLRSHLSQNTMRKDCYLMNIAEENEILSLVNRSTEECQPSLNYQKQFNYFIEYLLWPAKLRKSKGVKTLIRHPSIARKKFKLNHEAKTEQIFETKKHSVISKYNNYMKAIHFDFYEEKHKIYKKIALSSFKTYNLSLDTEMFDNFNKELEIEIEEIYSTNWKLKLHEKTKILVVSIAVIFSIVAVFLTIACLSVKFYKLIVKTRRRNHLENIDLTDQEEEIWKIGWDRIEQMYRIGDGNFGEVCKAVLKPKAGELGDNEIVAIKTLKYIKNDSISDDEFLVRKAQAEKTFMDEARRMTKLEAHHIIRLKGFCLRDKPQMVVMEFAEHGDLKTCLIKYREAIADSCESFSSINTIEFVDLARSKPSKMKPLSHIALEIADGMAYLEEMQFVHRDLAARNCMVTSDYTVKIGDFGLSRILEGSKYYVPHKHAEVPCRWLAPENINDEKYSSKSDVFSYGILLYELVTLGEIPYSVKILNYFLTFENLALFDL